MSARLAYVAVAALLASVATPAISATNLITNGDFSAGLAGWTETNSCCYYSDGDGFHEGAVGDSGYLSQTFADMIGGSLTLDFDYGGGSNYQYVIFNGLTVPGSYVANPSGYQHYTFSLGAGSGSDTLTFAGRNDPSYNTLAHVSVTQTAAVPEPASWALMLGGFGAIGGAMRSRRKTIVNFA